MLYSIFKPMITDTKIKPELDDEAWAVAKFIQELGKVQEEYIERLALKAEAKGWYSGDMSSECFKDWLYDYLYNSHGKDGYPECHFSEYLPSNHKKM